VEFQENSKTTENIRESCKNIIKQYFDNEGYVRTNKIMSNSYCVTDSGSNVVKVFDKRYKCACHNLNCLVRWLLNDEVPTVAQIQEKKIRGKPYPARKLFDFFKLCPVTKGALAKIKKLTTYFKHSGLNSKLPFSLKQDVPTRWNSELIMMESYIKVASEVKKLLLDRNELDRISGINDSYVQEMINLLTPLKQCSEIMSSDKVPTVHLIAPWFHRIRDNFQIKENDNEEIKILKKHAKEELLKEYILIEDFQYMACILNPWYDKVCISTSYYITLLYYSYFYIFFAVPED